jgi:hypothetical protein
MRVEVGVEKWGKHGKEEKDSRWESVPGDLRTSTRK